MIIYQLHEDTVAYHDDNEPIVRISGIELQLALIVELALSTGEISR